MGRILRTPRAGADLEDIWLYVAQDSIPAADRLIDRLVGRCQGLALHPRLGPARPDIAPDARMLTLGDYLILYRIRGDDVEIVRVVHGARQLETLFGDDTEQTE